MKTTYTTLLFSMIVFFIHTAKSFDNQLSMDGPMASCSCDHMDMLSKFCTPIKFTDAGLRCFFKHIFNDKQYPEYLSHNQSHMIQFLQYGKARGQSMVYMQSTLRLFHNRLKSACYITTDALSHTLNRLLPVIEDYFIVDDSVNFISSLTQGIKKVLYSNFLSKFSFFKQEPEKFFDSVSLEILENVHTDITTQAVDKEQFRQTVVRFLEHTISKLIWCPHDQDDIWESFKTISEQLACYMDSDIIYEDDLDDLYQTLIERFSYFLRLSGSELSLKLTDKIRDEIDNNGLFIFELEEQEDYVTPKAERLKEVLLDVDAKIIARQRGIITEVMSY